MNLIVNINKFYYIYFILFFFLAIFLGRVAGAPPAYLAMYGLSSLLIYNNFYKYKINIPKMVKVLFIFFTIYFFYSMLITVHPISTIKYYVMWILNISVVYFILKLKNIEKFLDFYLMFITLASLLGVVLHFSGTFYSSNPFDAFNKNSYIFLVMLAISISLYKEKKYHLYIILISSVFIYSRTLYLMLIVSFLFYMLSVMRLKTFLQLILISVFLLFIMFNISENNFIVERIQQSFVLVERLYEFFQYSDLSLGQGIGDHQRFYVIISNIDLLTEVFPIGTGMGLENYLSHINPMYSDYLHNGGSHRAHNYYISYLGEMGLFFFIFTYILYKPLFLDTNIFFKSLYFGMLVGIATNEYVTSPYFWILFALMYRVYYQERNLKSA